MNHDIFKLFTYYFLCRIPRGIKTFDGVEKTLLSRLHHIHHNLTIAKASKKDGPKVAVKLRKGTHQTLQFTGIILIPNMQYVEIKISSF